jgi:glycosyltransferase involved in cell wall biosynthesis
MLQDSSKAPWVSVVIPSLNRSQFLVSTVESVLQQDYPCIECLVVDGGSTDGTLDILRSYDARIKWVSEPDQGPPDAINKGWRMSRGEILAWLNADDLWAPGAVSKAVSYLQGHPEVDVVYGDCGVIDQHGNDIRTVLVRDWDLEYAVEHCDHIIYQAASFMRRSILERVGWLYPKLCHDHELWLRVSLGGGKLRHVPVLLAYARDHKDNLGYRSDMVIALKLDLTRKFFENPGLSPRLLRRRDRAMSNTYLRGMDYVLLDEFQWRQDASRSLVLVWRAVGADPSNVFGAVKRLVKLTVRIFFAMIRPHLPDWFRAELRAAKYRLSEKLFHRNFTHETDDKRT